MRIAISNDHAGFPLKQVVVDKVARLGASATFANDPDVRRRVAQLAEMERAARTRAGDA